jgi:translocon-associated protein subunit beta
VDESYAESDFDYIAGQHSAVWDRIPAESNVTHAVIVQPKVHGVYNMSYAKLTYTADAEGTTVVSYTSAPGYTVITSYPDYARKYESHIFDWIAFVVMVAPTIAIPFLVWHQSQSKYETLKNKKA